MQSAQHVFVYGSLRPDDDSGQSWTAQAVNGLTAQKARLPNAQMYSKHRYAYIVLGSPHPSSKSNAHQQTICNSIDESHSITGYVLSTQDEQLFKEKLQLFDNIEGYRGPNNSDNFYTRTVADVELIPNSPEEQIEWVKAYVYHGTNCDGKNPIPSGDWLQRNR